MRVRELIEKLQEMDQEAVVYFRGEYYYDYGYEWDEVDEVSYVTYYHQEKRVHLE